MSNRYLAILIVGGSMNVGWFWRIGNERGWLVWPLGAAAMIALSNWLWHRLDRAERRADEREGQA